jgi:hypothetical protein
MTTDNHFKIDRRQFLLALSALGATVVLPSSASDAQVNDAWVQLVKEPWYFEVNEYGTIGEADDTGPAVNSDVYEDIDVKGLLTPKDIIAEVDQYDELRERFQERCAEELEEIETRLEDSKLSSARRKKLEERRDRMQDPDDGWQAWVESGGKRGVAGFRTLIQEWLDEDVDWSQSDSWPSGWAGQDRAMSFFQDMDGKMLDALGVVIVEGDRPGSTYFAAELRGEMTVANAVAEREGLPFRFRVGV